MITTSPLVNLPLVVSHTLLLVYSSLSKTLPPFVPGDLSSNLALISLPCCYNLDKTSLAFNFVQGNHRFATSLDTLSAVSGCFLVHQRNQSLVLVSPSASVPCFFFTLPESRLCNCFPEQTITILCHKNIINI